MNVVATALKDAIMNCIGPENCTKCEYRNVPGSKVRCKTMLLRDALELLKDSEPVIRCKDCRWWEDGVCGNDYTLCQIIDCGCSPEFCTDPDWYCAEGEKR